MKSFDQGSANHGRSSSNIEIDLEDESIARNVNSNSNITDEARIFAVSRGSIMSANASVCTAAVMEQPLSVAIEEMSIYNVRTSLRRNLILATLALIAFLLPFCDTIYLPALNAIMDSLNTSDTLVAISVSIYLFMSGICSLLWGSIADRFGRKITMNISLITFIAASIVCIFAPNIIVLIIFRAIEGGTVSATLVAGQSIVADIYPEETRGSASGFFYLPFNIGPVVGPLIGGPLSGAFGWRSTFVFLTIFSFIVLVITLVLVPETHQYFVKESFHKTNSTKRITDASPNEMLPFQKPWKPITFLADMSIVPYIAVATATFATLFTSLTLFSTYLHEAPYSYTETIIGVLYVPGGVAAFTGSLLGGWLSDKASKYYGPEICPQGRLVPVLLLSICSPIGLIIFGWTFHYKLHVAGPIVGHVLLSFGQAILEPGVSAYLTARKQEKAGAVSSANTCLNFCAAGVIVSIAVPLENAMGTGPYFSLMCGINVFTISMAGIIVYKCIRQARNVTERSIDVAVVSGNIRTSFRRTVQSFNEHTAQNDDRCEKVSTISMAQDNVAENPLVWF